MNINGSQYEDLIGVYLSGHPSTNIQSSFDSGGDVKPGSGKTLPEQPVTIAGVMVESRRILTAQ